ncbi:hypothetical protein IAS59_000591 [Cryptococcus gattii]
MVSPKVKRLIERSPSPEWAQQRTKVDTRKLEDNQRLGREESFTHIALIHRCKKLKPLSSELNIHTPSFDCAPCSTHHLLALRLQRINH